MLIEKLREVLEEGFLQSGYDAKYGSIKISDRPDLCEFQSNGALMATKEYKKAPLMIAEEVVSKLGDNPIFEKVEAVRPGFINMTLDKGFLAEFGSELMEDEHLGLSLNEVPKKIIIDYGGPNVAKPLHIGHLRSAIIGEAIKRICRKVGDEVLGDVHLGDWGLQMGLIITEIKHRSPELPYFLDEDLNAYPSEPPFDMNALEEIYPLASAKSKEDEAYKAEALEATHLLQQGRPGYRALWEHILNVSVADLKGNYEKLKVDFDLWKKESDVQDYVPAMVEDLKAKGLARIDEGALVVDVATPEDTKEIPPCILLKSDGSSLYATTDLATIIERKQLFNPDHIIYVVDKRQEMHFEQVFRVSRKGQLVEDDVKLTFVGFGTMNGKDGKPFKTRSGGVMRLETLIQEINDEMFQKINENKQLDEKEAIKTAQMIGLSALKYGDLSNQAAKDYIFDLERFSSFEGNTGPYQLYTIVRIKSILRKAIEAGDSIAKVLLPAASDAEKQLLLQLVRYPQVMRQAYEELAPHRLCSYIFEVSNAFNRFYHETRILGEENKEQKASWLRLLQYTLAILDTCIDTLGFDAPERM